MRQKTGPQKPSTEHVIKDIRRATSKQYGAEEKIRIVREGLCGEERIAALCRRKGIAESLYYTWSKEFLEADKKRLAGDTARSATSDEVKVLGREARDLKEVVAEQALELRLVKKSMIADGATRNEVRQAADQGHAGAQYKFGQMNEHRVGCEVNLTEAFKSYHRAALQDHPDAREDLFELCRAHPEMSLPISELI